MGGVAPEPGEADQSGEPQGNEALRFNLGLGSAKNVRVELDVQERDAEGRLLAYVWLGDVMANAEVVARGYGQVVSGSRNVRHQDMLLRRQQEARTARLGIWRTAGPAPPPARSGPAAPEPRTAQGRPGHPPRTGGTCPPAHPSTADFPSSSGE